MQPLRRGSSNRSLQIPKAADMGRCHTPPPPAAAAAPVLDKADPRHWRQRRLQVVVVDWDGFEECPSLIEIDARLNLRTSTQRTKQQQASLALLPSDTTTPMPLIIAETAQEDEHKEGDETVGEAWVRRAGRLSEQQPLEAVAHLDLHGVDAQSLGGLECLGSLLPSLEVRYRLALIESNDNTAHH